MQTIIDETLFAGRAGNIARIPVSQACASLLKDGETIMASVEQAEGDALLLRVAEGMLLRALVQAELGLMQGDILEAVVDKSGGGCLLYMLNVSRADAQPISDNPARAIPQPTLSGMLAVLKRNPEMDVDMAMFLAENNIPATEENVSALTQLSRGGGIGALLGRILESVTQARKPAPDNGSMLADMPLPAAPPDQGSADTAARDNGGIQAGTPEAYSAGAGNPAGDAQHPAGSVLPDVPAPDRAFPDVQASDMKTENSAPQTNGAAAQVGTEGAAQVGTEGAAQETPAQPQGEPVQAEVSAAYIRDKAVQPDRAVQPDVQPANPEGQLARIPQQDAKAAGPGTPAAATGTAAETQTDAGKPAEDHIADAVRSLFVRPQAGGNMKKNADDMPQEIKALKSLLLQSDIRSKESCLKTADQALKQMDLADRTIRFEHMQLPVAVGDNECRTAELYVFRNRGSRKSSGEAGITILVALDTQHIGRVETLVREAGGGVSLEFRLEQAGAAEAFKRNSAHLAEAVEAAGYRLTDMRFAELEKKTTVLNAGEAVRLDAGEAPGGVDVRI